TNFHKSGYITQKNTSGMRFNENAKGMPFEKISDVINLFYIQPTKFSEYPETDNKHYYDLNFGNKHVIPPVIQGFLCKKTYDFDNEFIKKHENGNYFLDENIFSKFDLNLYIYIRKH